MRLVVINNAIYQILSGVSEVSLQRVQRRLVIIDIVEKPQTLKC